MLIVVSGWWGVQHWHGYILWPGQCNDDVPERFAELVTLARQQGYPGFQLSLQAQDGSRLDCAAGQAGPGISLKPMQLDYRIRYASLSKMFTAVVSQQLIAEERLQPDGYLLDYLDIDFVVWDERIKQITIGQLLRHTAGFDRSLTSDPMLESEPWCPFRLEGLGQLVLDHEPGSRYAYSNLGYCLLGQVIERIEGKPLQDVFVERIFAPASVTTVQPSRKGVFAKDEVAYRFQEPEYRQQLTAMPYDSMLATGAWSGTAADFLQLMSAAFVEGKTLSGLSRRQLLEVEDKCDTSQWRHCHGSAFHTYQSAADMANFYWRDGSLPGVTSFAGLSGGGQLVVFIANSRPYNWIPANDRLGLFLYQNFVWHRDD